MTFLHEHFLLQSPTAQRLYHGCAAQCPIVDFHNHLSANDIAQDRTFENLHEAWLESDHYKWRAMRANGIEERFITGDASPFEKFEAWARTVPHTLRNPLYHWTHLELLRYFGIETLLDEHSAASIWDQANEQLKSPEFSVRSLLRKFDVKVVGTTDDPTDSLDHHHAIAKSSFPVGVFPTFRPDAALRVNQPEQWNSWLIRLADAANMSAEDVGVFDGMLQALRHRHDDFHAAGGRMSDHDVPRCYGMTVEQDEVRRIFDDAKMGVAASSDDTEAFGSFLIDFFGKLDAEKGWAKQMHIGAFRNTNTKASSEVGADGGFDSVGDVAHGEKLRAMLDRMNQADSLPKTILYNLNPADNYLFGTMIGNFPGQVAGKLQWGSAWWFSDQKRGMEAHLNTLSDLGLLSRFVGMVTDSRSFLSFPRHEYFRRTLCNLIGADVENGELPADDDLLFDLVRRVCYGNAFDYVEWDITGRNDV